jgi:hypothetical protein
MAMQVFAGVLMRFIREIGLNPVWPPGCGYQSRRAGIDGFRLFCSLIFSFFKASDFISESL